MGNVPGTSLGVLGQNSVANSIIRSDRSDRVGSPSEKIDTNFNFWVIARDSGTRMRKLQPPT